MKIVLIFVIWFSAIRNWLLTDVLKTCFCYWEKRLIIWLVSLVRIPFALRSLASADFLRNFLLFSVNTKVRFRTLNVYYKNWQLFYGGTFVIVESDLFFGMYYSVLFDSRSVVSIDSSEKLHLLLLSQGNTINEDKRILSGILNVNSKIKS